MITKEIIEKGFELDKKRREPPFDEKGFSKNYENANKEYRDFFNEVWIFNVRTT
jgi:hypothetical protein